MYLVRHSSTNNAELLIYYTGGPGLGMIKHGILQTPESNVTMIGSTCRGF